MRTFEDSILDRIALMQELEKLPAVQVLSLCLQVAGYSQSEIAEVGDRHQQGIKYHVDKVRETMNLMPCGHSQADIVSSDEGTHYCKRCEKDVSDNQS